MKKSFWFLVLVLIIAATPAFGAGGSGDSNAEATATATGGAGGAGGSATAYGVGPIGGIGNQVLSPSAEATSINTNINTNNNLNTNTQGQMQGQGQSQFGYVAPVQEMTVNVPRELLGIPTLPTNVYPLITGGIVDWTANLPEFEFLCPLRKGDKVVRVLESYNGWVWNRICIEDLTAFVLKKYEKIVLANGKYKVDPSKIRFRVFQSTKVKGSGLGASVNAVGSALNGGSGIYGGGGGGGSTTGYNSSVADPPHTVEFYEIK